MESEGIRFQFLKVRNIDTMNHPDIKVNFAAPLPSPPMVVDAPALQSGRRAPFLGDGHPL